MGRQRQIELSALLAVFFAIVTTVTAQTSNFRITAVTLDDDTKVVDPGQTVAFTQTLPGPWNGGSSDYTLQLQMQNTGVKTVAITRQVALLYKGIRTTTPDWSEKPLFNSTKTVSTCTPT